MMRKKILISIDWFLPGTKSGGPVRSYANLIEHLQDYFEFLIITRDTDYGSTKPYEEIIPNTWVQLNSSTKVFYLSKDKTNRKFLKQLYRSIDFDAVFVNGIYSWYFSILPVLLVKKMSRPIIISARGMLNPQAFSVKKKKKKTYLKFAKVFSVYNSVIFHATNKEEAQYIRDEISKKAEIKIAPNLPRKQDNNLKVNFSKHKPVKFVNVARISKEKGTLTMLEALMEINESMHLDIYGPIYDVNYWKKCQQTISGLPNHIKVNYKGVLESEDVPKVLSNYDFFVMLSEGENFGHAILEALSVGLPVIISDKTPWKNLVQKKIGWDLNTKNLALITKNYRKALLMSDKEYITWSTNASTFAEKFINDPNLIEQNKALFLTTIENV
ncbi:glycosyltransferase family 4 protein [Winogradskyella flava]|uniref:glycosyltransferase family 4 protein n=1 Tax=Winogradskyella flava TaxID=1884876 RepID=UPI002490032D|nr:glycosyltransferase family 4 protein [Winogradskyella flava]